MRYASRHTLLIASAVLIAAAAAPANAFMPKSTSQQFLWHYCATPHAASFLERLLGLSDQWTDPVAVAAGRDCPAGKIVLTERQGATFSTWIAREVILNAVFFIAAHALGKLATTGRMHVNETRKLLGMVFYTAPALAPIAVSSQHYQSYLFASSALFLACLVTFVSPLRSRFTILRTAFASIDRIEDRPHTLLWFTTSFVTCFLIYALTEACGVIQRPVYFLIVITAASLGDIVAGVVGFRFGRHRYRVIGFSRSRSYTRSFEGSAAFCLTCIAIIFVFRHAIPFYEFPVALFFIPLAMTAAEMLAPHSWDDPLLLAAGFVAAGAVSG